MPQGELGTMFYRSEYDAFENCYHFTAATKYRKSVFDEAIRQRLEQLLTEKAESIDLKVHAVAAAVNHIHILVQGDAEPPFISQTILGYTSRLIRKEFPVLKQLHEKQLWGGKACTNIKDASHLQNATDYIKRHDPMDSRVE
ncbi:hypothetical protein B0W48_04290 [Pseudoalteromonas aliena]|uniref:Transposase IS200-like domain-containing protein n=1 Tax=Pseudoalteromonas aliena TaxID=247523 RepID=A0A1Q2GVE8_9GAMM|nr:IS200/IS605 family transposase [Pseudoalteromonas aliena]AQP99091.1 hypothetical protein B0W48_04290 [Pseudoalteromonas aliena]